MNYGPGDTIVCINTKGERFLVLGAEYTCRDMWRCKSDIFIEVEEVTNGEASIALINALFPGLIAGTICPGCGHITANYPSFFASYFIKKPEAADFEGEDLSNPIKTPENVT
jgi:hypothetical protein